jgi:UDP-N-acetylmuramyl pentapeptide phosphotransferase/UDP-N-acetylglucosamine-1-phosphate transferase
MIIFTVVGFWDDLKIMSAKRKLIYQIFIIIAAISADNLLLTNLNGFLGIYELPLWIGYPLTVFIGVFMINSFNLIDGIDGLSGFISIIAFTSFAIIFWVLDYKASFGVCVLMIGIILAYLPFNFSNKRKVFMGDSGSLFIGFMLFIMTMMVVTSNEPIIQRLIHKSILPIAPMTIFLYPMVDTASIYLYRLSMGQSPFMPDKWHTHHLILKLTNSHLMSSVLISLFSLFITSLFSYLAFWMSAFNFIVLFFGVFLSLIFTITYLRVYLKRQERKEYNKRNSYSSV